IGQMSESMQVFRSAVARPPSLPVRSVGFSALILYPPGCAQEGSLLKGFPTWRFRVLKTALRLRPRRALSSASGQKSTFSKIVRKRKSLNFQSFVLTNQWLTPVLAYKKRSPDCSGLRDNN